MLKTDFNSLEFGGDEQNRTVDPLLARQVLSQLSYTPIFTFLGGLKSNSSHSPLGSAYTTFFAFVLSFSFDPLRSFRIFFGGLKWTQVTLRLVPLILRFSRSCSISLLIPQNPFGFFLVGSSGLEPPTSRLSGVRSNHLSYEPLFAHPRLNPQN